MTAQMVYVVAYLSQNSCSKENDLICCLESERTERSKTDGSMLAFC